MHLTAAHHQILQALADLEAEYTTNRASYLPIWSLALSIGRDIAHVHTILQSLVQQQWITLVGTSPDQTMIGLTPDGERRLSKHDYPLPTTTPGEQELLSALQAVFYPPLLANSSHSFPDTRIAQATGLDEKLVHQLLRDLQSLGYIALAIDDEGVHDAGLLPAGRSVVG